MAAPSKPKLTPGTAPLPECCPAPAHALNEQLGTCGCLRCKAAFTFVDQSWQPVPAEPTPETATA